jgi:hypothetical protein
MPPDHYIEPSTPSNKNCKTGSCPFKMTLQNTDPASSPCTLGANFMQGHDVIFDMEQSRIGFAPSDCTASPNSEPGAFGRSENRVVNLMPGNAKPRAF